jgi:sterol desaturase/sphingolipid hydroxylase (fatty acid hydroxylase superfamily)
MFFWFITIVAAWLAADLLAGVFHWFEDRYLDETQSFEFLHGVANDNQLHHSKPTAMLLNTHWQNMASAAVIAWPIACVLGWMGFGAFWVLTIFFSSFANLVHRYSHEPRSNVPKWIRALQRIGLFCSKEHHDTHHRDEAGLIPKSRAMVAYCVMTDWVNPILDYLRFWDRVENLLGVFGLKTVDKRHAE